MKFTCTHDNLVHALHAVSGVANKQGHLPILQNILFRAKESGVELIATDLEIVVKTNLRAKVETPGDFTVPAKTMTEYVTLLTEAQVAVALEGGELVIIAGASSTKIKGMSAEEFPVIPTVLTKDTATVETIALKNALASVAIAAAKNDIRPELAGVFFSFGSDRFDGLTLAATDSYRLAEKKLPIKSKSSVWTQIVPGRAASELVRLLSLVKESETVEVGISDTQLVVRLGQTELVSRLTEGRYPDYIQIIPEKFATTARIPKDVLLKKIKAAGIFTTTGMNAVSFDVNASEKTLGVSSTSSQTGEYASTMEADVIGQENSILLNHRYVLEGLNQMPDETIVFSMNSGEAPCLFRGEKDDSYLYIVMPIRR